MENNFSKINIAGEKVEELSKLFSLGLADKLEKKEIDLAKMNNLMVEFFNLLNSAGSEKEITSFIGKI